MQWLYFTGKLKQIKDRKYTPKNSNEERTAYDLQVVTEGLTQTIQSSQEIDGLEEGKTYSFPVGYRGYQYDNGNKTGVSFFLKRDEQILTA